MAGLDVVSCSEAHPAGAGLPGPGLAARDTTGPAEALLDTPGHTGPGGLLTGRLHQTTESGPVPAVTRLPAPTVIVPTDHGRPRAAIPLLPGLLGYRPTPVTRPAARRITRVADPAPPLPAGFVGAVEAAQRLELPEPVLRRLAATRPGCLPPVRWQRGEPLFCVTDLPPRPAGDAAPPGGCTAGDQPPTVRSGGASG